MKETLSCLECGKDWKRDLVRGRKPKLCPKCTANIIKSTTPQKSVQKADRSVPAKKISKTEAVASAPVSDATHIDLDLHDVWTALTPRPSNWKQIKESTAKGSTWECPRCKHRISFTISIIDTPYHKCNPNQTKTIRLERVA